jgi:hypothetical protein
LVDVIIDEFGYDVTLLSLDERWIAFITICIHKLFQSNKRYQYITEEELGIGLSTLKLEEFINSVCTKIVALYLQIGFDVSSNDEKEVISLFLKEIGCPEEPLSTERSSAGKLKDLPKVWVEKYEGGRSELVKFQYTDGNVIVKLNKTNNIFKSNSSVAKLLGEDDFWSLIGYALHSHINQIDEIQDFFDAFARQLRLRGS